MTVQGASATPGAHGNGDPTAEQPLVPRDCPKFERHGKHTTACNAPVCVLDGDWRARTHRRGEGLCHYLRVVVKQDVQPRDGIEGRVLAAARRLVAPISAHFGDVRRRLARAAVVPSKKPPRRAEHE